MHLGRMEPTDAVLIAAVLEGDTANFEPLVVRYSPMLFAAVRRYVRRESDVEDVVQKIWIKAYQNLRSYRGEGPFGYWLMRLAVRTCYDYLRRHRRSREATFSEVGETENDWLERLTIWPDDTREHAAAARALVERLLEMLAPAFRLVITLLDIEGKSVQEISDLTGWSVPLVKIRAFRARAEMRKCLARIAREKYL